MKPSAQPTLVRTQHLPPPAKTARSLRKRGPAGRFLLVTPCIRACHCGSMRSSGCVHMVYSVGAERAVRNLAEGVLSVRQPEFRKSRLVPVSAWTLETLRTYHDLRIAVAPADPAGAFFVSGRGTGYSTSTVQSVFHDLTVQAGLREPDGSGPRLHDLRATFAVTRLLLWYRDGEDVMARLPLLSTYLGHACISDTEVYLRITTALLQEANTRFHAFAEVLLPATGDQS